MSQPTATTNTKTAGVDDLDAVARALALAFENDPVFAWIIPDPRRRRSLLPAYFEAFAELYIPFGETHLITHGAGAALWAPPDVDPFAGDAAAAFEQRMTEILDRAEHDRGTIVGEVFAAAAPDQAYAYLQLVGVEPAHQRRGLGRTLLAPTLARHDATGTPSYLEAATVDNRRLYERLGFATVGELTLPGAGPRVWRMWREPAESHATAP